MSATISLDPIQNRLLAMLSREDYHRLLPDLEVVDLPLGQVIHHPNERVEFFYFPHQAIVSLVSTTSDGVTVEVGLVGREGMVGIQALLSGSPTSTQAFVQVPGQATRISIAPLQAEFDRGGAVQKLILQYVQVLLTQVSQTAVCNRLHRIEARLARWLLLVQDAVESDELQLTQKFISQMLGIRRTGVVESAGQLQKAGLIRNRRGQITIVNRAGLEAVACECYQVVRKEVDRLLGWNAIADQGLSEWGDLKRVELEQQLPVSLKAAEDVGAALVQQKEDYFELFEFSPIAFLLTDADGLILEANQAIANLLNAPHLSLVGKPLAVFVAEGDLAAFRTHLNQLSKRTGTQVWQMSLCPRDREPVGVELHIGIVRNPKGLIENLRIAVYDLSQFQSAVADSTAQQTLREIRAEGEMPMPQLPQSLDGLRVLVVDDEADTCEFIVTLLEAHGISAKAVASAAAALDELEQFRPDVLLSDIRMPGGDGYRLIRQIRALEAQQGGHLPAAAMTAYQDEDHEKSLEAGFERHLYKLAQPDEWVEMVAQLTSRTSR